MLKLFRKLGGNPEIRFTISRNGVVDCNIAYGKVNSNDLATVQETCSLISTFLTLLQNGKLAPVVQRSVAIAGELHGELGKKMAHLILQGTNVITATHSGAEDEEDDDEPIVGPHEVFNARHIR